MHRNKKKCRAYYHYAAPCSYGCGVANKCELCLVCLRFCATVSMCLIFRVGASVRLCSAYVLCKFRSCAYPYSLATNWIALNSPTWLKGKCSHTQRHMLCFLQFVGGGLRKQQKIGSFRMTKMPKSEQR